MGMWDSDLIFGGLRLDEEYDTDEPFILDAIEIIAEDVDLDGDPTTSNADKTQLTTRKLVDGQPSGDPIICGTFASPIADKARKQEDGDLPAVVIMKMVKSKTASHNDARVLQFVRRWEEPKKSAKQRADEKNLPSPL